MTPIEPHAASATDRRERAGRAGTDLAAGWTVPELARVLRVSPDKIRTWIARGDLAAINTAAALSARPRWVIRPDALAAFEKRRAGGPPPKGARKRKRPQVDYYPG